jgi:hypothetical protein
MDISKIPCKYEERSVINDTPSRVCKMLCDEKIIEKIIMATQLPYLFTNSPIPLVFEYKMQERMFKETYNKFSYALFTSEIKTPILILFEISENTLEKNLLLVFKIEIIEFNLIPQLYIPKIKSGMTQICSEVINNLIKELKENNKDISHFESKVLNFPREKIWDILANIHYYMDKSGMIKECTKQVPIKEKGEQFTFFMGEKCKKKFCKLNVNVFKKSPDSNKWVMGYQPLKGPFLHSEHYWTLIKINDNQTMVANTTIYLEHVTPDDLKKLTETKKEMFSNLETLLKSDDNDGNFCSCEHCMNKIKNEPNEKK